MAFLSLPERKPAGIDARELATVPLVLVVSAAIRSRGGELTLADLTREPFVDFPPGYGNREVVDRAFAAAGVARRVALEVPDIDMGAALVRHGLGIAFLPAFAVARTPACTSWTFTAPSSAGACISAPRRRGGPARPCGRCSTWSTSTSSPCDARPTVCASYPHGHGDQRSAESVRLRDQLSSSSSTGGFGTSRKCWDCPGLPPFRACSAR
ncbi:LysR substrate-binding domain-containing protein [Streptomyces thermocarboxydus]